MCNRVSERVTFATSSAPSEGLATGERRQHVDLHRLGQRAALPRLVSRSTTPSTRTGIGIRATRLTVPCPAWRSHPPPEAASHVSRSTPAAARAPAQ